MQQTKAPNQTQPNSFLTLISQETLMLLKLTLYRTLPTALDSRNSKHTLFQFFGYCHLTFDALLHSPGAFYHEQYKKRLQLSPLMLESRGRQQTQEHQL